MKAESNLYSALDDALEAHRAGRVEEARAAYGRHLAQDAGEPLALYGLATIALAQGDIGLLPYAAQALLSGRPSTLDRPQAAEAVARLLLRHQYQDHARQWLAECGRHGILPHNAEALQREVRLPAHLAPTRYDPLLGRELERYRPIESAEYVYAIDIVGGCNLRCPTCPVSAQELPKGLMTLELYRDILAKIKTESAGQPDIWLFNWTEPMLHPQVDRFIEATHEAGLTSFLSTNLNLGARIEAVMRAKPTRLKVSLSSLRQEIYGQTHARGDIAQVVANLHMLAKWRDHYQSPTQIWIGHHLYRNTLEEQQEVSALAGRLGFGYAPSPAIVAPIERVMRMGRAADEVDGLRANLLYDPLLIQQANAQKRSGRKDCELRFNMTAIAHDGSVNLCCATTKSLARAPVSFLEHAHAALEEMKYTNPFCKQCMKANLHLTMSDQ